MAQNSDLHQRLDKIVKTHINKKKYKPAIEELFGLLNEFGDEDLISYYLGVCFSNTGDFDNCIQYLELLNSSDELSIIRLIQVNMLLGYAFTEVENYFKAEKYLKKALEINPKSSMTYSAMGYVYYLTKKYDLAIYNFKRALQIDPNNASAHNNLGYTYAEVGINLSEAATECRKAIALNPQSAAYRDSLGWVYFTLGNYKDSVKELQNALQYITGNPGNNKNKQLANCFNIINEHLTLAIKKRDKEN